MLKNQPEAEVTIGKPRKVSEEKDIQKFHFLLKKRKEMGRLSHEELEELKLLRGSLNAASNEAMENLATLLPDEKRGVRKDAQD